jgi:hypothetical protein
LRPAHPKPIAAWSFAQTDGDFVPDASGHGYDAQVYANRSSSHDGVVTARWHLMAAEIIHSGKGANRIAGWASGSASTRLSHTFQLKPGFAKTSLVDARGVPGQVG